MEDLVGELGRVVRTDTLELGQRRGRRVGLDQAARARLRAVRRVCLCTAFGLNRLDLPQDDRSRSISRRARGGSCSPLAVVTAANPTSRPGACGSGSNTPCLRSPLIACVSEVRAFTRRWRSRSRRLRAPSSTLGTRTRLNTAASPRPYASSARTIFRASARSVLRYFAFRFIRRLAGSSTTVSRPISCFNQCASQDPS